MIYLTLVIAAYIIVHMWALLSSSILVLMLALFAYAMLIVGVVVLGVTSKPKG
jgi:hypothetical protein